MSPPLPLSKVLAIVSEAQQKFSKPKYLICFVTALDICVHPNLQTQLCQVQRLQKLLHSFKLKLVSDLVIYESPV